jgi:hypothetical protein
MDTDELPSFQLTELVDELARSSDEEGLDVEGLTPNTKMVRDMASDPEVVKITPLPAPAKRDEGGPSSDRSAGERIASAFWRCAHEAGFTMLCEALTFTGLRDELPRLMAPGHTIMAPTNEAWAKMDESVRKDPRLVRQLLLGHMCAGVSTLQDLRQRLRPCGPRFPPPPPICAETCNWASDADCDGGGPGSEFRPAPGRRHVDLGPIVTCSKVAVCVRPVHNQSKNKSSKGRATHHRNDRRAPTITGVEKPAVASKT